MPPSIARSFVAKHSLWQEIWLPIQNQTQQASHNDRLMDQQAKHSQVIFPAF